MEDSVIENYFTDNESDKENSISPIQKRPKRTASTRKEEEPNRRELPKRAAAAFSKTTTKEPEEIGRKRFTRSASTDTSTTEVYHPSVVTSKSRNQTSSSRESSNGPKCGHSSSSSASSNAGSEHASSSSHKSSGKLRTRKRSLAIVEEAEDDAVDELAEDLATILFECEDATPIGPEMVDIYSDEDEEDEKIAPPLFPILDTTVREPLIVPDKTTGDYEVERVLLVRHVNKVSYYLLKWKDYPLYQMTWAEKKHLHSCDKVLKEYEDRVAVCKSIFDSLPDTDEYLGYQDNFISSIITPPFIEQNFFEVSLCQFMINNSFAPLFVENWTRISDVLPKDFVWTAQCLFSYATSLEIKKFDEETPTKMCNCKKCDVKKCSCFNSKLTAQGKVRASCSNYIEECSKRCACNTNSQIKCPSKAFRRGRVIPLMLFRTPKCGWSVRTMAYIPERKFVIEYAGLIKRYEECDDIADETYLFNCDLEDGTIKYVIDATNYGNESRFINHNCNPNLHAYSVLGFESDPALTRIVFFANRDIQAGEELTFDYFSDHDIDLETVNPKEKRACHCGAVNCRKYLF
uniref:Histone-lysine N-methyltransferase n=1 Tax=Panagrolaimus sp. PS1159 TaxID=55785 RepID=A0AC35FCL0_9BILA